MQRLSEFFYRKTSFWVVIITLALFIIYLFLILPAEAERTMDVIGDLPSPDTSFYYSKAELYQMAEDYGQTGRYYYVDSRVTFDIVWPFVYTFFLVNAISWVLNKTILEESKLRLLNLVPLGGILFDFLENISNMIVMFKYPIHMDFLASIAGFITSIKWIFVGGSMLILVLAVVLWVGVQTNLIKT